MTRRVQGLDLLRGVAVGLVLLRHAFPAPFAGAGVVGVVAFFALSGYLITGLLLDELDATGRLDLRGFYLRRARRLVPPLLCLVAGVVAVTLVLDPLGDRGELGATVLWAVTWTGDLPFGHASDTTFHLWTLALEEQFYLAWPAYLWLAHRRGRVGTALVVASAACAVACLATVWWLRAAPDAAYALPTSWAGCLVVGAAARWARDRVRLPAAAGPVGIAVLLALSVVPLRGHALTYLVAGPAVAVTTAAVVLAWRDRHVVRRWQRPLVALGTVSYAAYLWDYPVTVWLRPHTAAAGVLGAAAALLLAAVSWRLVEAPLRRRARSAPEREPVPA